MSAFADALRAFQLDRISCDQLLSELYRSLAVDRASPGQLRVELGEVHVHSALPADVRAAILERLASWDQTATTPSHIRDAAELTRDQPATVLLSEALEHPSSRIRAVEVGKILQGRFRLIELLGEGGMSRVFKAIDMRRLEAGSAEPHVAIKILTVPFKNFFDSLVALQGEAQKLQRLNHQNIVRVIDCDRDGQTVFMSMELLSGQSVYSLLRAPNASLPPDTAKRIITGIAHALEFAHRHHIVHGDLKPGNVILTDDGEIKVIDFGMARFLAGHKASTSDPPAAITPRYASPQMMDGAAPAAVDDVYALACLAYEVLSGRHPFAARVIDGAHDAARQRVKRLPTIPEGQFRAIERAMEFERDKRTQSVREFLDEFTATPIPARVRWAGAIAVVLTAALAVFFWQRSKPPSLAPPPKVTAPALAAGSMFRDCPLCPLMTVLAPGQFLQGSAVEDSNAQRFEKPQHLVKIARPFAIGQSEVTVSEFRQFIEAPSPAAPDTGKSDAACNVYDGRWHRDPSANWKNPGYPTSPQDPVSCLSWNQAMAYVQWLSATTGQRYRLPSASEWEYAARAGSPAPQPWSREADACSYANVADQSASSRYPGWKAFACNDRYVTVAPVGSFRANAFGLNDMLGNVFEWVMDCWHDDYRGAPIDGSARVDGECNEREMRGGSWFTAPIYMRTAYRNRFSADYRSSTVGFRVARELAP